KKAACTLINIVQAAFSHRLLHLITKIAKTFVLLLHKRVKKSKMPLMLQINLCTEQHISIDQSVRKHEP
ncbi:hypothetical protein L1D53_26130, partial [Vibrio alginolyticus]|nr:hypothetical protein [Vibrio alginolyticus]